MPSLKDAYIEEIIKKGDEGSALLAAICAPTLNNNPAMEILSAGMHGVAVLRIPQDRYCVVHSVGGKPAETNLEKYAASAVERAVAASQEIGATPECFADVIDASTGEKSVIEPIGNMLRKLAGFYNLAIPNGELAVLGNRIAMQANISITMVSSIKKSELSRVADVPGTFTHKGIQYAAFDPKGKALYMNSDGVGTKTEIYERLASITDPAVLDDILLRGLQDSAAMKADDLIKKGATARVFSDMYEASNLIPRQFNLVTRDDMLMGECSKLGKLLNATYLVQFEDVGNRLNGYKQGAFVHNISGSAVSTIDEEVLRNPPHPSAGNYLVGFSHPNANPRSNGISDKRKRMVQLFGDEWHLTPMGQIFMEYLSKPSTIFYPLFKEAMNEGLATSVYHMSGGAFKGKLAKPLAEHGLFIDMKDKLFHPDWREVTLAAYSLSVEDAYAKWPMRNEAFIATPNQETAIQLSKLAQEKYGLNAQIAGQLADARNNHTGITFKAFNGQEIYFSGKAA